MSGSRRTSQTLLLDLKETTSDNEGRLLLNLRQDLSPVLGSPTSPNQRQSPIDIPTAKCQFESKLIEHPLRITYPRRLCDGCVFQNTGHSWKLSVGQCHRYFLGGGPLAGRYCLDQVHAHWGADESCGSEHLIDGRAYAGELHFVHWNADKYETVAEALNYEDGLAVIGVLFKIGAAHAELDKLVKLMNCIQHADCKSSIGEHNLDLLNLMPTDVSQYWTYEGSLTTPPYSECVTWIVLQNPIQVSPSQLNTMRSLLCYRECDQCPADDAHCGKMTQNFRAIQPREDRCPVRSSCVPDLPARQQSPINIYTNHVLFTIRPQLQITYPRFAGDMTLQNTGQTWKLAVHQNDFALHGGPLDGDYELDHVHAHWGATDRAGSEHLVDNRAYAGELHFVHWNRRYENLANALTRPDGLAVIGVFLEVGGAENFELRRLTKRMESICYAGCQRTVKAVDFNLLLPKNTNRYWTYQGSLTTPPYFESVTWIVMKDALPVSSQQVKNIERPLKKQQHFVGIGGLRSCRWPPCVHCAAVPKTTHQTSDTMFCIIIDQLSVCERAKSGRLPTTKSRVQTIRPAWTQMAVGHVKAGACSESGRKVCIIANGDRKSSSLVCFLNKECPFYSLRFPVTTNYTYK